MRDEEKFAIFDDLFCQLENSLIDGKLQRELCTRQKQVQLDLMAIAHLQTTISAHAVLFAEKILNLPCEIRDSVIEFTGLSRENVQEIVQKGGEITPGAAVDAATACLECVIRSLEQERKADDDLS